MAVKTNKILPFAVNAESNDLLSDDEYQTDVTRTGGNIVGIAKRRPNNKALKQASLIASALADIIARGSVFDGSKDDGYDIDDSLDRDTIAEYLFNTFTGIIKETSAGDDTLVHIADAETITGAKTFTSKIIASSGVELSADPAGDNDAARKAYIDNNFTLLPNAAETGNDANNLIIARRFLVSADVANLPVAKAGFIDTYKNATNQTIIQLFYPADNSSIYARTSNDGGTVWGEWSLQTISDLKAYVKSVNGVTPDPETGNVNIEIPDIKTTVLNTFFPVGSIYMDATGGINPNIQFGGTWVKIENRFLYGQGTKGIGATGGAETVTLNGNQIPQHKHGVGSINGTGYIPVVHPANQLQPGGVFANLGKQDTGAWGLDSYSAHDHSIDFNLSRNRTGETNSYGAGQAHENMPPYLVVAIWKRTA